MACKRGKERNAVITNSVPKSQVQRNITKQKHRKHGPLHKLEVGRARGAMEE